MRSAAEPILELRGVHAYLGSSHILQGVDFDVPAGKVTMLLGRNGVGKTTTLRSILGLGPRSGSVRFQGKELTAMPPHKIVRLGIGYVPEDRDVFHGLTVAENLRLAERPGMRPRYELVYDLFPELQQRARQAAGTLSGGQQQMVSVGRALLNDSPLLLIDEPTKGLAPKVVTDLVVVLERVAEVSTVLMVEQNLAVAERLADNVVVMDHGSIIASGPADELMSDREAMQSYLGVTRRSRGEDR